MKSSTKTATRAIVAAKNTEKKEATATEKAPPAAKEPPSVRTVEDGGKVIVMLKTENPYKAGSRAERFDRLATGLTVQAYIALLAEEGYAYRKARFILDDCADKGVLKLDPGSEKKIEAATAKPAATKKKA